MKIDKITAGLFGAILGVLLPFPHGCRPIVRGGGFSVQKTDIYIGKIHYIVFKSSSLNEAPIAVVDYTNDSLIAIFNKN